MGKEKMTKLEKQWVLYDVGKFSICHAGVHHYSDLF